MKSPQSGVTLPLPPRGREAISKTPSAQDLSTNEQYDPKGTPIFSQLIKIINQKGVTRKTWKLNKLSKRVYENLKKIKFLQMNCMKITDTLTYIYIHIDIYANSTNWQWVIYIYVYNIPFRWMSVKYRGDEKSKISNNAPDLLHFFPFFQQPFSKTKKTKKKFDSLSPLNTIFF